jgi:hypothetical protein
LAGTAGAFFFPNSAKNGPVTHVLRIVTRRVRFVIGDPPMTVRYPEHS